MTYLNTQSFILKGHICYSETVAELTVRENQYCICVNGICEGVFPLIPYEYQELPLIDCGDRLIIPGLIDLHTHAPQYAYRGLGMDEELLNWLEHKTFPEESQYADREYAEKAYRIFTEDLQNSATTRACIFATVHQESTWLLMELLEKTGMIAFVGKVNMDRNAPDCLREADASLSLEQTKEWLERCRGHFNHVKPILTPRFIPTCTDELMAGLGRLQREYDLPVQSHLSENESEAAWVLSLCEGITHYAQGYSRAGMFGDGVKTVMAHCVVSQEEEIEHIIRSGVYVAHCPQSNTNLSSGIAPIRRLIEKGALVGLGSDIAGGSSLSIFRAITDTIQVSKLRNKLNGETEKPITTEEAFYLATKGGGSFFGKVGSFEKGYELDALVLEDAFIRHPQPLAAKERLERFLYLGEAGHILHKYVAGNQIF